MNKFKLFFLSIIFIGSQLQVIGQNPVTWTFQVESLGENTYKLIASAQIQNGWFLYSQNTSEEGPVPTSFNFNVAEGLEMDGEVKEISDVISGFDPLFETVVKKFKNQAVFEALFKTEGDAASIAGFVTFMTCDGLKCLPPDDVEFDVSL